MYIVTLHSIQDPVGPLCLLFSNWPTAQDVVVGLNSLRNWDIREFDWIYQKISALDWPDKLKVINSVCGVATVLDDSMVLSFHMRYPR